MKWRYFTVDYYYGNKSGLLLSITAQHPRQNNGKKWKHLNSYKFMPLI